MDEPYTPPPLKPDARWPNGLAIRGRLPADAAGVAALHNLPGYRYGTLRMPHQAPDEVRKDIENKPANSTGLVALIDGTIVGDIGLSRYAGRRDHAGNIGMGVHDAYVGRGIGQALLGEILAVADNWLNLQRIELTVFIDNERAIRLYEKNGFVTEGHFRDFAFRDGCYIDAYTMARRRTDRAA